MTYFFFLFSSKKLIASTCEANLPLYFVQEDQLCQETQIKCLLIRLMEPVWTRLVSRIVLLLSPLSSLSSSPVPDARSQYVLEGLRLWKSLISIRANINSVESRNLAGNLSACVHALQVGCGLASL
jgi:hypothetical protein